jgi:PAS domain S-box-containing protein
VSPGKCICGKVLESKNAIFLQKINHSHDINYSGMRDHGHYCVPILYGEQVLGVLNTYIGTNHDYVESEMNFLKALADTLAGIIARKNAEEELQATLNQLEEKIKYRTGELIRSEEIYRTTVDTFNDWVYVVDKNLNLISINKALFTFFKENGITNIMEGQNIRENFGFLGEQEFETIYSVFETGAEFSHESEYEVFGKSYYTERIISPVKQNNEVVRVVVTVHDYTKLKQVEEDIRKTLEKEKELNMLKSRFISTVSHEFRTPLAGILSSIQLLKRYGKKWDDEKKEKTYQQIVDAVHHTKTLLDDVALIDKQQNQSFSFRPSSIDLQQLVRQIIDDNTLFYNSDCKINLDYTITESSVYLDPTMVRHIITNLVSNAIKYSGESKEVNITINKHSNNEIEFIIADNGIGIPEEDQKHLFVAFHRASNVEGIQGTGFGMSVVKRFVELHKGNISVESTIGVGTTVKVILPINLDE